MDNTTKFVANTLVKEDWNNPAVKFAFPSGCGYFEALKAITDQLADFQEDARQDGSYIKTAKLTLKSADADLAKEFHFDSPADLDKAVSDYFAEAVPGDGVVSEGSLEVFVA